MGTLFSRLYFKVRPFVPHAVRLRLRQRMSRRALAEHPDDWYLDESAGRVPEGWPGWPGGKQFAFVLTHDVEDQLGHDQTRAMADLEESLGFRSSFNFVPEGDYRTNPELRAELTRRGFEVGVHDLHHDGKLYASRAEFRRRADRINQYLHEWGAVGFRSAFMLHELDWLHDLDVAYDASTFDIDPFEPQPDGMETIFPFWVPAPASSKTQPNGIGPRRNGDGEGYLELPYTLPQDSTLFIYLGQKTIDIWLRKLDWVASRGGMALVNVHPDYLAYGNGPAPRKTFPSSLYADFLKAVRERYPNAYWHPLPREIGPWWHREVQPTREKPAPTLAAASPPNLPARASDLAGRRAGVVLYSYFPSDSRPRRAAEAMVSAGMSVEMLCLQESPAYPTEEEIRGVRVTRLPLRHRRAGKLTYIFQYLAFGWFAFWHLSRRSLRQKYDVIHVHNMPDFLVFTALLPRWRGARLLLDLHDPMPELCTAIYGLKADAFLVRVLRLLERLSLRFAHLGLTPNIAFKKLFVARGCPDEKMQIIMNSPEEAIFRFHPVTTAPPPRAPDQPYVVMFHGSLVHRHGLDLAVDALSQLLSELPHLELRIYGAPTPHLDDVLALAQRKGMQDRVQYFGEKSAEAIAQAISEADLGVIPNRRSSFTERNFPTRIFEYLALGKPVVTPDTSGIQDYFPPDALFYFKADDPVDLARAIRLAHDQPEEACRRVQAGQAIYRTHLWANEQARFLGHVSTLVNRDRNSADR